MIRRSKNSRKLFLYIAILLLISCGAKTPAPTSYAGKGMKVGKVQITSNYKSLEGEREDLFKSLNGFVEVNRRVRELLKEQNIYDPNSTVVMNIDIKAFRVRSLETHILTGLYSGLDFIEADVAVIDGSETLASNPIKTFRSSENPFNYSRESRASALFDKFAEESIDVLLE